VPAGRVEPSLSVGFVEPFLGALKTVSQDGFVPRGQKLPRPQSQQMAPRTAIFYAENPLAVVRDFSTERDQEAALWAIEQQSRRMIGYRDLATLVIAVERHAILAAPKNTDRQEIPEPVTV
jgi:hypothetical protein